VPGTASFSANPGEDDFELYLNQKLTLRPVFSAEMHYFCAAIRKDYAGQEEVDQGFSSFGDL